MAAKASQKQTDDDPKSWPLRIFMANLISLRRSTSGPESIARNLEDGDGYSPDWAWQLVDEYITEIAAADNESAALDEILKDEDNNSIVAQTLLFYFGRECAIARSIRYAISCLQHEPANHTGSRIAAMVIADRTVEQIADQIGSKPEHVAVYEQLCFDIRRYRKHTAWLKNLCYHYQGPKSSEPYVTRWLTTAYERGWDGLCAMISKSSSPNSSSPSGVDIQRELELMLQARGSDYLKTLDMQGAAPTEADLKRLSKYLMNSTARARAFGTSRYPRTETPTQENKTAPEATMATQERMEAFLRRFTQRKPSQNSDSN